MKKMLRLSLAIAIAMFVCSTSFADTKPPKKSSKPQTDVIKAVFVLKFTPISGSPGWNNIKAYLLKVNYTTQEYSPLTATNDYTLTLGEPEWTPVYQDFYSGSYYRDFGSHTWTTSMNMSFTISPTFQGPYPLHNQVVMESHLSGFTLVP
ncbi:hypothetical protein DJ568_15230 [Mucilaginibacter hurinus]|uniref:Uncharacterized protein n=1 Tax=Mucilaginibacter hurinus TaxID=2201324 RepID=A0A367GKP2_9SPHI|nr:hypothetical protein [Mucilaginibacter hurinus]RCH53890.1 hypothetical protein DJ568_15230 [Mucilaginibacter hurinus]